MELPQSGKQTSEWSLVEGMEIAQHKRVTYIPVLSKKGKGYEFPVSAVSGRLCQRAHFCPVERRLRPSRRGESMNVAGECQWQAGIVPAFASLMGTDRDKGSRPAPRLHRPVLFPGKSPPATLAAGDLVRDMELLAVTAPEETGKDTTASQAEGERVEKASDAGEVESPAETGLCGKVVTPEGAEETVVEASENPEAERVAEAFAQAAERIAVSEVAKVLQSAIAELKGKRRSMWIKPRNTTQQEEDWVKEGEVK
ncbi:hypothetical protein WISP_130716 [Willisornis vidua]|uniref:Uncharacterized protein n=1 Tax=Willisornis vidua TaxID=1566151 RepID=A0ABQ9CQU5_9PASS|nr:hypothetical protein WISP_130716 [Willisornis vidua]